MAYENSQPLKDSVVAATDLSTHQYKFVKLDGNGNAVLAAATTDVVYGVLQNKPKAGDPAEVTVIGITKVLADAALAPGNKVGPGATGRAAVVATTGGIGQVRLGALNAGEVATVTINCASPGA